MKQVKNIAKYQLYMIASNKFDNNIWMVSLKLNWIIYDLSGKLQLREFVWMLRSSLCVVFNQFLLTDATDRSKISSDPHRICLNVSLYPLSLFVNTPFKEVRKFTFRRLRS